MEVVLAPEAGVLVSNGDLLASKAGVLVSNVGVQCWCLMLVSNVGTVVSNLVQDTSAHTRKACLRSCGLWADHKREHENIPRAAWAPAVWIKM